MENNNEKSIDTLNSLIECNNDRIEGYERALKETSESDLRSLFTEFADHSRKFKQELASEVRKLGGEPEEGTSTSGKLYRAWMDVKAALTSKDRRAILSSCETGEDVAVKWYEDKLKDGSANSHTQLIRTEYEQIKKDHDKVRDMRDSLIEA
jgi:uncharacterized protein (TIGR02284 family)